jgi:ankyrin repeat protein
MDGYSELLLGASSGDLQRVKALLSAGEASIAEEDEYGNSALLLSASYGMLPMAPIG